MAKRINKKDNKKTHKIEVNNFTISNIDRSYKGIPEWRSAIKAAESADNPRRTLLYDLYEEVVLDLHLTALIEKRQMFVTNIPLKFFDKSGKEVEIINDLINTENFEEMMKDLIDCRFYGHSLIWFDSIEGKTLDYKLIPRKHVNPRKGIVMKHQYDDSGEQYREAPYNMYCLEAGKPDDLGLLSKAALAVIYKKGNVSDWSVFAQVFGAPFREYIYDDPTARPQLEAIAKEQSAASYVVRPRNSEFKLHETTHKSGSSDLYSNLAKFCDEQNSKAILLNTMTTDAQGGNYKGEVHASSEKEVAKADRRFMLRLLNEKFIPILEKFGYAVAGGRFGYEEQDGMTPKERFEFDEKFSEKAPLDDDYWYETYNRPRPKKKQKELEKEGGDPKPKENHKPKPAKKEEKKEEVKLSQEEQSFWLKLKSFFSDFPRS
ncbi:DUF935 family protein [Persicobacter sp. CCB-QB2]|uniref:phage portal protein family protein n=1 Tax=Persicobacter sp. CCB-QB2 TaxID=1561025 RepID=UPI0006A9E672|nr:DUF935 family protein [Persicobacter sp. CCB-QB2]